MGRFVRRMPRTLGFDRFSGLYLWALIIILFGIWTPDTFLTTTTLKGIASQDAITAILALGILLPLAAGAFDLSVGAMLGFSLVLVTYFQSKHGWSPAAAILITVLIGLLVGAINGFIVVKVRVNSFIATLGMSSILGAAIIAVSGNVQLASGISEDFTALGRNEVLGIPLPVIYLAAVAIVLYLFLEWRPVGRRLYATGSNPVAARLTGVRTDRLVFWSLVFSGGIAALAGVILAAVIGSASLTAGPPYLLPAFAAVFLGSTQIHNGRANVLGTLVAVYLLATGVKGLLLVGAPLYVNEIFNGVALIVAVALAVRSGRQVGVGAR